MSKILSSIPLLNKIVNWSINTWQGSSNHHSLSKLTLNNRGSLYTHIEMHYMHTQTQCTITQIHAQIITHTHTHTHIYTHTYAHAHTGMHACMHVCTHAQVR